jgi:hypothetical protein
MPACLLLLLLLQREGNVLMSFNNRPATDKSHQLLLHMRLLQPPTQL